MQPDGVSASQPNITALLQQAVALHQQGKLQAASSLYQQILDQEPRHFDALHLLGVAARQCGQPALAIELMSDAIAIKPGHAQAHCNLGAALQDVGRAADALIQYNRAIALHPRYDMAHCNRGNTLRKLGRPNEALDSYDVALAIRPTYPEAACNRAIVLHELGRSAEAVSSADTALALRPRYPEALLARANALQGMGRFSQAVDSYTDALAQRGEDAELFCSRGTAHQRMGQHEQALADYERALALRPDYSTAQHYRANSLQSLGRREDAIAAYQHARELGANGEAIDYAMAALGATPAPQQAPAGYVRALFDQYASHFDQHLVDTLHYRTPAIIAATLQPLAQGARFDTLDLGCGTGLCGPHLKEYSHSLAGVDLSSRMLDKARERGLYDELACAEMTDYLSSRAQAYDLVVAADVLVYVGDLGLLFQRVRAALRPHGLFCFTVEISLDKDFELGASNRYAHSLGYLQRLASENGMAIRQVETHPLRRDKNQQVMAYVVVMTV